MKILRRGIYVAAFTMLFNSTTVAAEMPTVTAIMQKMEAIEFIDSDLIVKMTFTQHKKDQGVQVLESVFYRRDADDSFLMVMAAPEKEKGNGYLRVGDNIWMYRRNSRTFQKMSRYERIAGTDSRASDYEKRKFTALYEPILDTQGQELLTAETLGKAQIPVYRFEVLAKVKDVDFPKTIFWVTQADFLTLKTEDYSVSGTHMATSYTTKYMTLPGGKYLPEKMIFVDEFEKGNKTILDLSQVALQPIDHDVFTKAHLENLSK